jgi:hypothetical protein
VGIGHGAPFRSRNGRLMYVFHAHNSVERISPRLMYINSRLKVSRSGVLKMDGKVIVPELTE